MLYWFISLSTVSFVAVSRHLFNEIHAVCTPSDKYVRRFCLFRKVLVTMTETFSFISPEVCRIEMLHDTLFYHIVYFFTKESVARK